MKGVQKHHNQWQVTYGKRFIGRFDTEEQAIEVRTQLERQYGKPNGNHKRIDDKIFGNLRVVGETNMRDSMNRKIMLTFNNKLGRYENHLRSSLLSGQSTGGKYPKGSISFDERTSHYRARIGFHGENINLGTFETLGKAKKCLDKATREMKQGIFQPLRETNYRSTNKLNHKYLSPHSNNSGFIFSKTFKGKRYRKYFNNFTDALTYRNQWLTDHNLPIPD